MTDWFSVMAAGSTLPADALHDLHDLGFVVIPGPVDHDDMGRLADAMTPRLRAASPDDVRVGSTTTRVTDLVNRGPEFDALYVYAPVLEAACRIIGRPFRLSTHARTDGAAAHAGAEPSRRLRARGRGVADGRVHPDGGCVSERQRRHPLRAAFSARASVGARSSGMRSGGLADCLQWIHVARPFGQYSAAPRRSIQGAFIRREAPSGVDLPGRMRADTLARIGPLAKYVLAV